MSPAGPFDTLIFDLDHTLFDFAASEQAAYRYGVEHAGLPADGFTRYKEINRQLWAAVERGEHTPSEVAYLRFAQLLGQEGVSDTAINAAAVDRAVEVFRDGLGRFGELYDGVEQVLDTLTATADLALVTNGVAEIQHAKIERLGLARWFRPVIISDEVGVAKPDPAIFDLVFAHMGEERRATSVMIGDSLSSDIAGAHAAGIATCWYNPAGQQRPDQAPVDFEVRLLDELPSALQPG